MILLLLLAAGAPQATALDAERAFDRAAAREGQWTAFREFAAPDAIMFVPEMVEAREWLKDRRDPPKTVRWQPTASYQSCDGKIAVNTGNWQRPDGSVGYFTTVWGRLPGGQWKWLLESDDALPKARSEKNEPIVVRADCVGKLGGFVPAFGEAPPPGMAPHEGFGMSPDSSLIWRWELVGKEGRTLSVSITKSNPSSKPGSTEVIHDVIAK